MWFNLPISEIFGPNFEIGLAFLLWRTVNTVAVPPVGCYQTGHDDPYIYIPAQWAVNGEPLFGSAKVKVRHNANLGSAICRMLCAKRNKWRIDKYIQFQRQTFEIGRFRLTSAFNY